MPPARQELIEGAHFSPSISSKCPASELPVFEPPPTQSTQGALPNDKALVDAVQKELSALNATHAKLSPVSFRARAAMLKTS